MLLLLAGTGGSGGAGRMALRPRIWPGSERSLLEEEIPQGTSWDGLSQTDMCTCLINVAISQDRVAHPQRSV